MNPQRYSVGTLGTGTGMQGWGYYPGKWDVGIQEEGLAWWQGWESCSHGSWLQIGGVAVVIGDVFAEIFSGHFRHRGRDDWAPG